jgi:hypothetical protein
MVSGAFIVSSFLPPRISGCTRDIPGEDEFRRYLANPKVIHFLVMARNCVNTGDSRLWSS